MPSKLPYATSAAKLQTGLAARDGRRRSKTKRLASAAAVAPRRRNDLLPKLQLVDRDPRLLIAPARNVREVEADHVRRVANAISTFGFTSPVLIDGEGRLVDGVVRVEAAKLLNLPTIPCIAVDALTASELKLLRIATNRLGENGGWQLEELRLKFEELIIDDAPIEISGFELTEIDGILAADASPPVEPGPLVPETEQPPVARSGDVLLMGSHRVICGDARDASTLYRLMQGDMARFVFTDQPYNVPIGGHVTGGAHREFAMASGEMSAAEFAAFNEAWIGQAMRYLVDGGVLATFIDWRGLGSVIQAAATALLAQINLIVWSKTNAGMGSLYRSQHELLPIYKKGDAPHVNNVDLGRKAGRSRTNVWTYPGASSLGSDARQGLQDHPTVKPVAMLADALLDLTHRGEVVLDPFLGSGSTLIAAEQTGRVCRGVEIDPCYVDLIARRYEAVTGTAAVLEATGETFADLAQRRRSEAQPDAPATAATPAIAATPATGPEPEGRVFRKRTRLTAAA